MSAAHSAKESIYTPGDHWFCILLRIIGFEIYNEDY